MPPITLTQIGNKLQGYSIYKKNVSWNEIAPSIKLAAIASEDQLFPYHQGFDWNALQKSFQSSSSHRLRGAGASTISQQTAKNVFLWQGEGWTRYIRKIPEFYFTQLIEWLWGKKRILEVYLNVIETGPGIYGVEAAAQQYFHKSAKNVGRKEAAMIIACLPNPKRYTVQPLSRWVAWKHRWILNQMNLISDDKLIRKLVYAN